MGILNTARAVYASNQNKSLIGSLGTATKAHIGAALHPTNMIGRAFGYGSFVHSFADRHIGSPRYLPGGVKNHAKSNIRGLGGQQQQQRSSSTASASQPERNGVTVIVTKQLSRIEHNTGQTVGLLERVVKGEQQTARSADIAQNFAEENATEQNRLFESLGEKLERLSLKPGAGGTAPSSKVGGGMWDVLKGVMGAHIAEKLGGLILGGISAVVAGAFTLLGGKWLVSQLGGLLGSVMTKFGLGFLGVVGLIGNGLYEGFKKYQETGDLKDAIPAMLSGMTLGLLSPEFIENWFLKPLSNAIDGVFSAVLGAVRGARNWLERNLGSHNPFGSTKPLPPPRPLGDLTAIASAADRRDTTTLRELRRDTAAVQNEYKVDRAKGSPSTMTTVKAGGGSMSWDIPTEFAPLPKPTAKATAPVKASMFGGSMPELPTLTPTGTKVSPARGKIPEGVITNGPYVVKYMMDKGGFSREDSIAIAANMGHESAGFKTNAVGDAGKAFGLMQWNDRGPRMKKFAADRGKTWTDLNTQLDYAIWELKGPEAGNFEHVKRANSIAAKTEMFSAKVERPAAPHYASRREWASKISNQLGAGGAIGASAISPSYDYDGGGSKSSALNVPAATAGAQSSAIAASAAQNETSVLAAGAPASYAAGVMKRTMEQITSKSTADKAIPPPSNSSDSVDDIISKILVAMGAVSQT